MQNSNSNLQAGQILLKDFGGVIQVHAFNFERQMTVHIGTIRQTSRGVIYEKAAPVLMKPEPSFCFTTAEFSAVLSSGVEFIHVVPPGKLGTYSIDVERFSKLGTPYFNGIYGDQKKVPLSAFSYVGKTFKKSKRWERLLDR